MDYVELFRPVFAYALHLARANPNRNRRLSDPEAIKNDLASLIAIARSDNPEKPAGSARLAPVLMTMGTAAARSRTEQRAEEEDVNFNQAWYAVASWLGEILADIPGGRRVADELLPPLDPDGCEFYRRLGSLLTPGPDDRVHPEIVDIVKVYSLCLELDYAGYYSRPGCEHLRQAYRRRCRQVVEAGLRPPEAETEPSRRFFSRLGPFAGKAALWILPVAGTIVLYGIYRSVLNHLYNSVVG